MWHTFATKKKIERNWFWRITLQSWQWICLFLFLVFFLNRYSTQTGGHEKWRVRSKALLSCGRSRPYQCESLLCSWNLFCVFISKLLLILDFPISHVDFCIGLQKCWFWFRSNKNMFVLEKYLEFISNTDTKDCVTLSLKCKGGGLRFQHISKHHHQALKMSFRTITQCGFGCSVALFTFQ